MAKLTTVYWRDIPAQVIAKERRDTAKIVLTERFAEAIDKAAMRAGMAGTDAYLEEWRREARQLRSLTCRLLQTKPPPGWRVSSMMKSSRYTSRMAATLPDSR